MTVPWLLLAITFNRCLTVATQLLVGFLLVPEQVGVFAVAAGLAGIVTPVQSGDLARVALQDPADPRGSAARVGSWLLTGAAGGWLVAVLVVPALGLGVARAPLACLAALAVPRVLGNVRVALLARAGRSRALAAVSAGDGLLRSLGVAGGALLGAGMWSLVLGEAAAALGSLALLVHLHPGPAPGPFRLARPLARKLLAALAVCLLVGIELNCTTVAIGRLCGPADAGSYAFAYRIAAQLTVLLLPLIALEAIPRLLAARDRRVDFHAVSRREIGRLLRFAAPLVAVLALAAPPVITWVWHDTWRAAAEMLRWLGPAAGLRLAYALAKGHLEALGAFRAILALTALDTALILGAVLAAGTFGDAHVVVRALAGEAALILVVAVLVVRRRMRDLPAGSVAAEHAVEAPAEAAQAGSPPAVLADGAGR
jgi:O-antigen/teichoic acid export membrane protein